jgi:magnesium-transporting ATPase (P-type)
VSARVDGSARAASSRRLATSRRRARDPLLSGSAVLSGGGTYRATVVGEETFAARLTAEARRYRPATSELRTGINRILVALGFTTNVRQASSASWFQRPPSLPERCLRRWPQPDRWPSR